MEAYLIARHNKPIRLSLSKSGLSQTPHKAMTRKPFVTFQNHDPTKPFSKSAIKGQNFRIFEGGESLKMRAPFTQQKRPSKQMNFLTVQKGGIRKMNIDNTKIEDFTGLASQEMGSFGVFDMSDENKIERVVGSKGLRLGDLAVKQHLEAKTGDLETGKPRVHFLQTRFLNSEGDDDSYLGSRMRDSEEEISIERKVRVSDPPFMQRL